MSKTILSKIVPSTFFLIGMGVSRQAPQKSDAFFKRLKTEKVALLLH
ncbi:hypothetical protein [Zobellia barbeyronii]|uniref:Uncharacterized protein n=1 Tax=Zobellia barbeyronii TaxID=2748009 RepID=A0ABS5WEV9_9FLAO|nr:hypothetical protein [Zobellia barbeyronii]MBT2161380.1 hypothetical protein [Zobellia barbeyronii]